MRFIATTVANVAKTVWILNTDAYICLPLIEFNKATIIAGREKKAAILRHKGKHPKFSRLEYWQFNYFQHGLCCSQAPHI